MNGDYGMALTATVRIEAHRGCRPYDRMIFGQFLEHFHRQVYGGVFEPGSPLADARGFRTDVIEALRELRIPIVRWPGGCFVSAYHWTDGVGPNREPTFDKAWSVEEPHTFGTGEFVAWCAAIGAEPYICTNAGTGTAEEMSDWVEYCNGTLGRWARRRAANGDPEPHGVKYWSIGNENWGGHEIGAKTAPEWAALVTESAKMMLRADPSIKLLAAALPDVDWTLPLLKAAGRHLSYISIHRYWDALWQDNTPSDYATCMMRSTDPERTIRRAKSIIDVAGLAGKVGIAFDEWNLRGWHHPHKDGAMFADVAARDANDINATYTMADAVFSACFLNTALRHAETVRMACIAPVVNARGPLFVHPDGVVKRTTFHVMAMYANHLADHVADAWVTADAFAHGDESVPALDAVATCDEGMSLYRLALINRHPTDSLACTVMLGDSPVTDAAKAVTLSGDSCDACNDLDAPDRVTPTEAEPPGADGVISLRPHSVTVVEVG
jgi:alpha-N-arabinofuranosidase